MFRGSFIGGLLDNLYNLSSIFTVILWDVARNDIDLDTGKKLMDLILTLRQEARGRKDYASADLISKSLSQSGINVMDSASGASWEIG